MKCAIGSLLFVAVMLGLAGCNTVQGFGQDMEAAGEAIQNSARRN